MPGAHLIKNNRLVFSSPLPTSWHGIHTESAGVLHLGTQNTALSLTSTHTTVQGTLQNRVGAKFLTEQAIREDTSLRMGTVAEGKPDSYAAGVVPPGAAYTGEEGEQHFFLSKNGDWGAPSPHVGAVYETFKALTDTPNDYGELRDGQFLKYEDNNLVFADLQTEVQGLTFSALHTNSIQITSDANAKVDIELYDVNDAVNIMKDIDMVTFRYKEGDSKPKLGVIAQELESVMPQAVSQGDKYKQVDFTQLVSLLMATTKVLISKVSQLETKMNALDER